MKKNICMIAYSIYAYDSRIRREAEALVAHGDKVIFLVLAEGDHPRAYESNGVDVIEMKIRKYRGNKLLLYFLSYIKFLTLAFFTCTKLFLKFKKVDIVHVHNMPNFLVFAAILPRLFGRKVILDIHDSVPETYGAKFEKLPKTLHRLFCLEECLCCGLANKIICVNDIQKERLLNRGIPAAKISVVLNVPDQKIFKYENIRQDNHKETFDLVFHGTIDKILGIELAIEAVSRLVDDIPGIHLHILGRGRNLEECEKLAEKLNIRNRVHFSRKFYPVENLPNLLQRMDLGIVPNKKNIATELMLPVKMMEYVAIGIPVVSARLKTIEHYFSDNMVTYFEPENIESLADAILKMYCNKDERQAQVINARKFVEMYGWENHQMELIKLYQSL